jgi:hypothetical protein
MKQITSSLISHLLSLVAVVVAATGFVDDEAENLALLDVVKSNNPHIGVTVSVAALIDFLKHFLNTVCVKQRKLPHCPVVVGGFRSFVELDRREITLVEDVLNLLSDLLIAQRRQVGKSFVAAFFA